MRKKILIVGSKGMAGHIIYYYLKRLDKYEIADISRNDDFFSSTHKLDVTDIPRLDAVFHEVKPDITINCVGILNRDAETNPDKAILGNSFLPHHLARKSSETGGRLIHISTDCVFNGKKGGYSESSPKDGEGFYAQSKALGEVDYGGHLTLRTSIIGPELKKEGIGLFNWFMQQTGDVKGYTKAIWTGITTIELAQSIEKILSDNLTGLHHIVNGIPIAKYDLLVLAKDIFGKTDIVLHPDDNYAVNKSLLKGQHFPLSIGSYSEMLAEMKTWIDTHKNLYPGYYYNA